MTTAKLRLTLSALTALVVLLFAACADDSDAGVDRENPDIRGEVTSKTDATEGSGGTILIEGVIEPDTEYDGASVRVNEETAVYRLEGDEAVEASWDDLETGQQVEAWFTGPVAESYPVQATAERVIIIG